MARHMWSFGDRERRAPQPGRGAGSSRACGAAKIPGLAAVETLSFPHPPQLTRGRGWPEASRDPGREGSGPALGLRYPAGQMAAPRPMLGGPTGRGPP